MNDNSTTPLTDEELAKFEQGMSKCMTCHNWNDVTGKEALKEYDCQFCDATIFCPFRISEFWLYDVMGSGGMGSVFRAQQYNDPKVYAIKISEYEGEDDFRFQSLLYEGNIIMDLEHDHIPYAYRFGHKHGNAFLLMDFEPGLTLDAFIATYQFSEDDLMSWMIQLAETLKFMATKGYIYRDLKPQNIIIQNEKLILVDFGLAMHLDHADDIDDENLVGSPSYIPPERIIGKPEDIRSDIYALGMVFYYVAHGHNYFEGSPHEIVEGHLHEYRYPILELNPEMPPQLAALFDKLLAHNMEDRYQNYDDLIGDLNKLLEESLDLEMAN